MKSFAVVLIVSEAFGTRTQVRLERDLKPRAVKAPAELRRALEMLRARKPWK